MDATTGERRFFLQPGYIFASNEPHFVYTVLGSCVAVCLWDSDLHCGGMNHHIYARPWAGQRNAQFGTLAVPHLLRLLRDMGCRAENLRAHVIGGAENPEITNDIGRDNVEVAETILERHRVRVVSRDIGGLLGRKVVFHTASGEVVVYKLDRIRETDWYDH